MDGCAYEIQRVLGSGAFGQVCLAKHKHSGELVAIKRMDLSTLSPSVEAEVLNHRCGSAGSEWAPLARHAAIAIPHDWQCNWAQHELWTGPATAAFPLQQQLLPAASEASLSLA
jgi:serine/threonine protein kinase